MSSLATIDKVDLGKKLKKVRLRLENYEVSLEHTFE